MDYDEALKILGLSHLKGNTREILKAINEIMKHDPGRLIQGGDQSFKGARKGSRCFATVLGFSKDGEMLVKPHVARKRNSFAVELLAMLDERAAAQDRQDEDAQIAERYGLELIPVNSLEREDTLEIMGIRYLVGEIAEDGSVCLHQIEGGPAQPDPDARALIFLSFENISADPGSYRRATSD